MPFTVDGAVRGEIMLSYTEERRFSTDDRAFLAAIAKEVGQSLLRAQLHAAEQRARGEAEDSRSALAFLAEASRVLAESLDYETTIPRVAELSLPLLGEMCTVDIVEADGSIRSLAVAHIDPRQRDLLSEYGAAHPPDR